MPPTHEDMPEIDPVPEHVSFATLHQKAAQTVHNLAHAWEKLDKARENLALAQSRCLEQERRERFYHMLLQRQLRTMCLRDPKHTDWFLEFNVNPDPSAWSPDDPGYQPAKETPQTS